jgi:hypothetical protein
MTTLNAIVAKAAKNFKRSGCFDWNEDMKKEDDAIFNVLRIHQTF